MKFGENIDYGQELVSWSLTSLFSTNMAISETNYGQEVSRLNFGSDREHLPCSLIVKLSVDVKLKLGKPVTARCAKSLGRCIVPADRR